jgi:LexA-binding, inner membrane-associated putative hydrolase
VLGGVAAGWLIAGAPAVAGGRPALLFKVGEAAVYACLGVLPDLDLLAGSHRGPTHSVSAAIAIGTLAIVVRRSGMGSGFWRTPLIAGAACAAAYGSHVLLDWLSSDNSTPVGIMALWPFARGYYESDLHLFMAISRRYYQGWAFIRQNVLAVLRELAILGPVLVIVGVTRRRRR